MDDASDPNVLVGPATMDDAGVVQVRDDLAIIQTADFITPIVDDPYTFGRIAATNALSDVFAMGGRPLSAINLVAWPARLDERYLNDMLRGGADVAQSAGCPIVGGHTVCDDEVKYGLSVNGCVHPDRVVRNQGARPGDVLLISKAIGTGILATALKKRKLREEELDAMVACMTESNAAASEAALEARVHAMTDVTGFGLAGHLSEMLSRDSDLGVQIDAGKLPLLPGVWERAPARRLKGGLAINHKYVATRLRLTPKVESRYLAVMCDPQTSGGLAVALPRERVDTFLEITTSRGVHITEIGEFDRSGMIQVCHNESGQHTP